MLQTEEVEKTVLVNRLKEADLNIRRFLKVSQEKKAFENEWQNRLYTPEELKDFPRWGINGGDQLVLVDVDNPKMVDIIRQILPATFETVSPRRKLPHFYFKVVGDKVENKILHLQGDNEGAGEIRAQNHYLVAPGTEVTWGKYLILHDRPIAVVSYKRFMEAITPYLGKDKEQPITYAQMREGVPRGMRHEQGMKYATFLVKVHDLDAATAFAEMQRWNQLCTPPISDERDLKRMVKNALGYPYDLNKCWSKKHEFQPVCFAKGLIKKYFFKTTESDKAIHVYNSRNGIYTETGDVVIEQEMAKNLSEYNRNNYFRDIQFNIRARTYFVRPLKQNEKIACLNGLLNSVTQEFEEFTPKEFVTVQLPHRYDPDAKCPKIIQFLTEVIGEQQLDFMQEFMGYCLYPGYPIHRAAMLVGDGENGKSTLINLISAFLGAENISSMTLQSFSDDKFSASELYNKLANLSADLPSKTLSNTGMFKMLTGGDPISTARKYKGRIHWINRAKMLFSCNQVPESNDDTRAWWRRWHIIECKNYFPPTERDIKILQKICTPTETSGLLNWALQGLRRLLENGRFSVAEDHEKVRKHYMRKSNSARAFIEECLEQTLDSNDKIEYNMLYKTFISWCHKNHLPTKKKGTLTQNMSQYCSDAECVQERYGKDNKKRRRTWRYLKFVTTVTTPLPCSGEKEQKKLGDPLVTPVTENKDPIDETSSEASEEPWDPLKKW